MKEQIEIKQNGSYSYVDIGEGQPVVLLHGLFGALSNWHGVISDLSSTHRVIVPMLPLYTLPLLDTNVKALATFLREFLVDMKIEKPILLGNSLGGHAALIYVLEYGEDVKSLILTGSSGLYENSFGGSFPKRESLDYIRDRIKVTFYDPELVTDDLVQEVYEILNDKNKLIRILAMSKSAIRHNMKKDLFRIQTPTCLIWGRQDQITPPEVAEEFHSLIQGSKLYWIDKCGHAPMMEHSDEFNQILRSYLQDNVRE